MAGRPTKLTKELQETLIAAVRRTYYLETAADLVGIDRRTVQRWVKRGRKEPGGIYGSFCRALKIALAEKSAANIEAIENAGHWTSRAWLQERRFPEQWGSDKGEIRRLAKELEELKKSVGNHPEVPPGHPPAGK